MEEVLVNNQQVRGVRYVELASNSSHEAFAPVVVNVTGPWVDQLLERSGRSAQPLMGGTKGSHLVVEPISGAPNNALYIEAEADHRPFFIIPWNGLCLIGTTDIRFEGDLDQVRATPEEVDYLLREANLVLPAADLTRKSVLYTYSGIRPLPHTKAGPEGAITRRHIIKRHGPELEGLYSIVGGKLTTYRNLARQLLDRICRKLGSQAPCVTGQFPLPGSTNEDTSPFREHFAARYGLSQRSADHLLQVYGRRAHRVMQLVAADSALGEVICDESGAIAAEIPLAFDEELAQRLGDVLLRRTMVGLGSDMGRKAAPLVAKLAASHQGWTKKRTKQELADYLEWVESHLVSPENP